MTRAGEPCLYADLSLAPAWLRFFAYGVIPVNAGDTAVVVFFSMATLGRVSFALNIIHTRVTRSLREFIKLRDYSVVLFRARARLPLNWP